MADSRVKTRWKTDKGMLTEKSHDGGKTWRVAAREELLPYPGEPSKVPDKVISKPSPARVRCSHQTHGACLTCRNAQTLAERELLRKE